ncbi:MAG: OmpH family outer membrane protein [Desulfocapsaceae bacterium]|nr:OmpH family outer membrane protein [Desulfocapsaceae bacterium]
MMVGKKIMLLGVICLCASLMMSKTGNAADVKIGVMNGQKVIWTCAAGVKAKAKLEAKMKELQERFKADEQALVDLQNEIQKKSSAWTETKKNEKMTEFNTKRRDLQAKEEDARAEMNKLKETELQPIINAIQAELETFGKEHGYTVILDSNSGAVPYFNGDSVEISDTLVKEINQSMAAK